MNEECIRAHEALSAAYDRQPITAEQLQAAKDHCRSCAECARFVAGLARLRDVEAPQVPLSALNRALDAVRAEAALDTQRQEAARRAAAHTTAPVVGGPEAVERPRRTAPGWWSGWAAAAAGIVLVVGVTTVLGARYLMSGQGQVAYVEDGSAASSAESYAIAPAPETLTDHGTTANTLEGSQSWAVAPAYVVFEGLVYQLSEDTERLRAGDEPVGTLTTDLGTGSPARREVYRGEGGRDILVAVSEDEARIATLVVRELDRKPYGLSSPEVTVLGSWPGLPAGFQQPTDPDGGPAWEENGRDDEGESVYTPPGADPASGFAIAPGTDAGDPAAANPGWTWWTPLR